MKSVYRWVWVAVVVLQLGTVAAEPSRPNFIVINIDDLGYADTGAFGSTLNRTPNIDRMAKEGCKLTSFYAAPVCSPSRAALMTGCYAKRALPIPHVLFPIGKQGLHPSEITVAEILKGAGYRTGIIGKWHLGDQPEFLPTRQGFDYWFGLPYSNDMGPASDGVKSDLGKPLPPANGKGQGQPPLPLMRNETVLKRVMPDDQQQLVELYTNEAVKFITENKGRPFFLYVPHNSVHFPLYPGKNYAGKSPHGYYSDWVEETDWSVGRILDTLREQGLAEKTLVIFTSDNGGTQRGVNKPLKGFKSSTNEGGVRVSTVAWWPGRIPAGSSTDAISAMFDILPTFAHLAGAEAPKDRKLDGMNLWPLLSGAPEAKGHNHFLYFKGLELEAVRQGSWKLVLKEKRLYQLDKDPGESSDVSAENAAIVEKLQALAEEAKGDLGLTGTGPGCRQLGVVETPQALIGNDGKVRTGFEPGAP